MRILLTGKNGQLGFELQRSLAGLGDLVAVGSAECDFTDEAAIRRLVRDTKPHLIVNSAAFTAVDKAEEQEIQAWAINAQAPGVLAEEAKRMGAMLVHYSTDYVFDGLKSTPYTEADIPSPVSVYGATKLGGERFVQQVTDRHLILRTSWVYGTHGNNFARTMLRLAALQDSLEVVADQQGSPTSAALLADVTLKLLGEQVTGLFHLTASGETTWHAYACHIIERARAAGRAVRVSPDAIHSIATSERPTPARRPANSRLDTSALRARCDLQLPAWQEGVDQVVDQLMEAQL